jgi:hypothetical protein
MFDTSRHARVQALCASLRDAQFVVCESVFMKCSMFFYSDDDDAGD